jgi:hypothetical protein
MLAGVQFFVSCSTDDNIDVSDLDSTIGIGTENFKVPFGGTNDIRLSDVLELKEGDVIETLAKDSANYKAGDYQFKKSDDLDPAQVKIKEVHFETFNPQNFDINIPFIALSLLPNAEYSIPTTGPETITTFDVNGPGNADVVSLTEADLDGSFDLNLGLNNIKNEITLTQIDLYLPKFLELDLDYIKNHHPFIQNGIDFKLADENAPTADERNYNLLVLKDVATNSGQVLKLKLKRVDGILNTAPTSATEQEKGYMVFSQTDGLKLHGVVKMQLKFKKQNMTTSGQSLIGTDVTRTISPVIAMPSGIYVTHAEGFFNPTININPSTVNIGDDVPDFLTDDDVNISLNNPTIKLAISSNINAKAQIRPKMIAYFNEAKTDYKYMYIRSMEGTTESWPTIQPNTSGDESKPKTTYIIINRNGLTNAEAQQLANETGYTIERFVMDGRFGKKDNNAKEVTDISELLSPRIPKSLDFEIEAYVVQQKAIVDLYDENDPNSKGGNYEIIPKYEFVAPLALNANSTIVYNDTIKDMNKDLNDNDIDFRGDDTQLVITANVTNDSPLDLELDPKPIGLNGVDLSNDIEVSFKSDKTGDKIVSNMGTDKKATAITIVLKKKTSTSDLKKLDGIAFKVKASSANSQTLNKESHKLKIADMLLTINGKVSLDLDSKKD